MLKKKGVEIVIISLVFLLLLVTNILAATDIKIKTLPNKKIFIQYLKNGEVYSQLKASTLKNTGNGDILITDYFADSLIDLRLILKDNSKEILNERIKDIKIGEPVYISFVPGNIGIIEKKEPENITLNQTNTTQTNTTPASPPPENKTDIKETNTTKEINASRFSLTGFAVGIKDFGSKINSKIPWKMIIYIILGIIAIVIILFLVVFAKKKFKDVSFRKYDSNVYFGHKISSKPGFGISSSEERALRAAEEKIRIAQEEINLIRHRKEKIKEAERKLEQDKRELERLRGRF